MADQLIDVSDKHLRPLVEADGGTLSIAREEDGVHVVLSAACAGCPGFSWCKTRVIEPLLRPLLSPRDMLWITNVPAQPAHQRPTTPVRPTL